MRSTRLTLALETGALTLPAEGRIAIFRPGGEEDLSPLPLARLAAIQGFRPDHDALARRGIAVAPEPEGTYAAVIVCLPRARAEGRALIAAASTHLPEGAPIVVDGQKTDGVDSALKDCRARADVGAPVSKAHGKLFAFTNPGAQAFTDWQARPTQVEGGFTTLPGLFSADGPDRGSRLLAEHLPGKLPARVVDLGAGWGYLARAILAREGVERLDLVEAEHAALACARLNVTDPRAAFHWADARSFRPEHPAGAVITNPPFHQSRAADPELGQAFLSAAAHMLSPSGALWLVANRTLPYEAHLAGLFREVDEIAGDGGFKLFRAARPARPNAR